MSKRQYLQKKRTPSNMVFSRKQINEAITIANLAMALMNLPLVMRLLSRMSTLIPRRLRIS